MKDQRNNGENVKHAVVGSDAAWYIDGGGSGANPNPARLTTILDGITVRAGDLSVE